MPRPTDYSYHLTHRDSGAESLTVIDAEGPETITSEHPNYCEVKTAVQNQASRWTVRRLLDVAKQVALRFQELTDRVKVRGNTVFFDNEPVDGSITNHIVRFLRDPNLGDWRPLVAFLENISANPNDHSRTQLYDWLRVRDFTITDAGEIIGYKGVAGSAGKYHSVNSGTAQVDGVTHTGQIPNPVGCVISMPRDQVSHDPGVACHRGLHVGTFEYAGSWARGAMLEVAVNPRDVVSVPTDARGEKIRVARYKVLRVIEKPETSPLYGEAVEYEDDGAYDC